jgi:hypothetical protein
VALAVIGWPQLDGSGGRPVASLVMFPVIVITAGLAGLGLTAATEGSLGLRQLRARLARWRLGRWWLLLLLPPLGILLVLTALRILVSPDFAPQFLVFGIGAGIVAGLFEEIGWTGGRGLMALASRPPSVSRKCRRANRRGEGDRLREDLLTVAMSTVEAEGLRRLSLRWEVILVHAKSPNFDSATHMLPALPCGPTTSSPSPVLLPRQRLSRCAAHRDEQ